MSYLVDRRGTGRTTRMLTEAFRLAKEGKAVYVLGADSSHVATLEKMADDLFGIGEADRLWIKIVPAAYLDTFSFHTMKLRNAHPNCIVLVDHWTIECLFASMLFELHRYDGLSENATDSHSCDGFTF